MLDGSARKGGTGKGGKNFKSIDYYRKNMLDVLTWKEITSLIGDTRWGLLRIGGWKE